MGQKQTQSNGWLLHPHGNKYQPQIGTGAVGQGAFNVNLGDRHYRGSDGSNST